MRGVLRPASATVLRALRLLVFVSAALILAAPAAASEVFSLNAQDLTLQVNGDTALISYTTMGKRRHLLACTSEREF